MLWFALQIVNRTIFPSSIVLNMLDGTLFVVCLPLNTFSFDFRYFDFQIHTPYLSCCSFRSKYLRHTLLFIFKGWKCSINIRCLCFGFENINCTFVPTSKPVNMLDGALFVDCFLVNTLFLLFSGILTCNYISLTYLVTVYTLNTRSTPCCLFITTENVPFIFDALTSTSNSQPYYFSIFET